jgi:hypothetical protein
MIWIIVVVGVVILVGVAVCSLIKDIQIPVQPGEVQDNDTKK